MVLLSADTLPLEADEHIVIVRQAVRLRAIELGFSLVDQTKVVTARARSPRSRPSSDRRG